MNNYLRKIDNTEKIFYLEDKKYKNVFRFTLVLKENINLNILKNAIKKAISIYPSYKVKLKNGLLWNYFDENKKDIIVEKDNKKQWKRINLSENNDYLFKVSYLKNKINLDIHHVLTDGVGATDFLKVIVYNYLNIKHKINNIIKINNYEIIEDKYIKCADKKIKPSTFYKNAFLIKEASNRLKNKTFHYIFDLKKIKNTCKSYKVSITEYITTIYMLALYKSIYNKKSKKDISITIPINLRDRYKVETLSNFFTRMNIHGNLTNAKKITFKRLLNVIHKEFKTKLTNNKIKSYLARDVKLGTNPIINIVPLFIKKICMKYTLDFFMQDTTSTLSNVGKISIDDNYKQYIDNIMVQAMPGKLQKAKCTMCSYENKLTITLNTNLISNKLEQEFHKLLTRYLGKFELDNI